MHSLPLTSLRVSCIIIMFWVYSKAFTFSLSHTHTDTFPFPPLCIRLQWLVPRFKGFGMKLSLPLQTPFHGECFIFRLLCSFSSFRCRSVLRAFASCLEELRLLTPALVPYGPLYKDRHCQQTNWQQSPPTAAGERENLKRGEKKKKTYTCEPGDRMRGGLRWKMSWRERRLASCWGCIILQPSVGSVEVLLSFSEISQPCGGRLERAGGIACRPSISATWAETGKVRMSHSGEQLIQQ